MDSRASGRKMPILAKKSIMESQNRPSLKNKAGFALGHVMNDMCASMWFTYLLLYFHKVLEFDNIYSGVLLLIGQLADGISTVFVGFFSDSGDNFWLCNRLGQRKSWHLIGNLNIFFSYHQVALRSFF